MFDLSDAGLSEHLSHRSYGEQACYNDRLLVAVIEELRAERAYSKELGEKSSKPKEQLNKSYQSLFAGNPTGLPGSDFASKRFYEQSEIKEQAKKVYNYWQNLRGLGSLD